MNNLVGRHIPASPRPEKPEAVYDSRVDEITMELAGKSEFIEAVEKAASKMGAVRSVYKIIQNNPVLRDQISSIPNPEVISGGLMGVTGNEMKIAKQIVDLLFGFENRVEEEETGA